MKIRRVVALAALVAAFGQAAMASDGAYPTDPASLEKGQALAQSLCASCHAVGTEGDSAIADAPAFRALAEKYPLESLEESLAEGIVTAHENMPEIAFEPDEIDAFLGYLTSIQGK